LCWSTVTNVCSGYGACSGCKPSPDLSGWNGGGAVALAPSLSLLRVPFWSGYPTAQSLWVKTQSSSWTSDGGACGRRNLLGGVISRDSVRSATWPACCLWLLSPMVSILSQAAGEGGRLTQASTSALLLVVERLHLVVVLSTCSVPRCLGLLGNPQCGAG
jgi:hypothetical protein